MGTIIVGALGLALLIIGGFPHRTRWVFLRRPYGRILGGVMLLWAFTARVLYHYQCMTALIIITVILAIATIVCIILSLNEPVR
jgi:hypothetical protein